MAATEFIHNLILHLRLGLVSSWHETMKLPLFSVGSSFTQILFISAHYVLE